MTTNAGSHILIPFDLCHTRDFVARVCNFTRQEVADAATVELHAAATLSQKKTNTASAPLFPFHDPHSQTQFQNGEIVPYLIFSELFDYSHAIILQASLLKPKYW